MRLEFEGYEVIEARDGLSGIEQLLRVPVDLIILDIMMPRMDGFTFYRTCREHEKVWPIPPIIVATAFSNRLEADKRKLLGDIPVVDKPFDVPALLKLIRRMIG